MQIVSAIATISPTTSPVLIANISQNLLGISALAANSLNMNAGTAATITVWQELRNGQRFPFLTNKLLPTSGAFYFSDLVKGAAFLPGDKLYASAVSGEAVVSFSLYVGSNNQRISA